MIPNKSTIALILSCLSVFISALSLNTTYEQVDLISKTIPDEVKFTNGYIFIYNGNGIVLDFNVEQIMTFSLKIKTNNESKICPLIVDDSAIITNFKTNSYAKELIGYIVHEVNKKNLFTDKNLNLPESSILQENYIKISYKTINGVKINHYYQILKNVKRESFTKRISYRSWRKISKIVHDTMKINGRRLYNTKEIIDFKEIIKQIEDNKFLGCFNYYGIIDDNSYFIENTDLLQIYNKK